MALPAHLSTDDLVKFRTRFCERFLQFGECNFGGKCQYSHNMTWRRRSPQKYLYEPRLCENIVSFIGDNGLKRQSVVNCHNGKNCKCAHSREEILYHPLIYKTTMCENLSCAKYYCPYGHCVEELLASPQSPEYVRRCLMDAGSLDETDSDLLDDGDLCDNEILLMDGSLRMRKASGQLSSVGSGAFRLHLPVPGSPDWNVSDMSAWVTINPSIRIETVVRAHSPVVSSELCRALVSRTDTAGLAAKKNTSSNGTVPNQFCLAKVFQIENKKSANLVVAELTTLAKTEHKNLLSIKRVHLGAMPGGSQMLCLAIEQASTSLYQAVVDGYRSESSVRGLAKKLNPHNGTTTLTAIQRINDMVSGLQRLHFGGIAHLRICPTNILIDNEAGFKLGDFVGKIGLVGLMDGSEPRAVAERYLTDSVGVWQAPELTQFLRDYVEKKSISIDGKRADIFSLGCVVFYAMTGQHPFGTFASGDRLGAAGSVGDGSVLFAEPTAQVVENMLSDYVANQHLLYACPLVLDLVLRCLSAAEQRIDVADLSRHPLFWDFDVTRSFVSTLPFENATFFAFTNYELIWKNVTAAAVMASEFADETKLLADAIVSLISSVDTTTGEAAYSETIFGISKFLLDAWNLGISFHAYAVAPLTSLWLKTLDSFPQILVRLWDAQRLGSNIEMTVFKRNHLHWMSLRAAATTCVSHQFVREYYSALAGADASLVIDESAGLTDACAQHGKALVAQMKTPKLTASKPANYYLQDRKGSSFSAKLKPMGSPIATPSPPPGSVAGMTFVDPMVVKQMAAASAALSAVYDNPELVAAITKGEATAHNQLIATATIYSSLLEEANAANVW